MLLLQHMAKDLLWREYMATVAYSIGAIICGVLGREYPIPAWGEFNHPERREEPQSAEQIIDGLIGKLRGGETSGLVQTGGPSDA